MSTNTALANAMTENMAWRTCGMFIVAPPFVMRPPCR